MTRKLLRYLWLSFLAGLIAGGGSPAAAATPLFNGVDLSGWTKLGGDGTYHVENGEIVGISAEPSSPNTFLTTDNTYADFTLDLDFLISDTNFNSGVQFRSQSLPEHNNGRVFGYQAEIDPSARAWTGGIYFEGGSPDRPAGWLDDLDDNPTAQAAFVLGDWNHLRIVARDRRMQTWINGVPAADYTDTDETAFLPSGFFGLQVHQVSSPTPLEVRWRDLQLGALPTLIANRETGELLLQNDMDVAVDLQSYSIASSSGSLDGSNNGWQSLSDQLVAGWSESSAAPTLLEESTAGSPYQLLPNNSLSLGHGYAPAAVAFGTNTEDLDFLLSDFGIGQVAGDVQYVGQNVTNNLVLLVDPSSGQAVLKNTSPFDVSVVGYSILSPSGSLHTENWDSLSNRGVVGWDTAPAADTALSEVNPDEELLLAAGDRYNLGNIFNTATGTMDLQLEFLIAGAADYSLGGVLERYAADFNLDQSVDASDLQIWHDAYALDGSADANGDGRSDGRDFLIWQQQHGLVSAPLQLAIVVPEPCSVSLSVLGFTACFRICRTISSNRA